MALRTKKEFAELCGIETKHLSTYAGRGKVIYTGEYVDDTLDRNKGFMSTMQAKKPIKQARKQIRTRSPQILSHVDSDPFFDRLMKHGESHGTGDVFDRIRHTVEFKILEMYWEQARDNPAKMKSLFEQAELEVTSTLREIDTIIEQNQKQ